MKQGPDFRLCVPVLIGLLAIAPAVPAQNDGYVIEPFAAFVHQPHASSRFEVLIPRAVLDHRCGDLDGCSIRLTGYHLSGFDYEVGMIVGRFVGTDGGGTLWKAFDNDLLLSSGATSDAVGGEVIGASFNSHTCRLRGDPASNGYALEVETGGGAAICILRIYD